VSTVNTADGVDVPEQARSVWRESMAAQQTLTGRELGERFGRSERWGRARIAEVRRSRRNGTNNTPVTARRHCGGKAEHDNGDAPGDHVPAERQEPVDGKEVGTELSVIAAERQDMPAQPETVPATTVPEACVPQGLPPAARLVTWAGFLFGTAISVA